MAMSLAVKKPCLDPPPAPRAEERRRRAAAPSAREDAGTPLPREGIGGVVGTDVVATCTPSDHRSTVVLTLPCLQVTTSDRHHVDIMLAAGLRATEREAVVEETGKSGRKGDTGERRIAVSTAETRGVEDRVTELPAHVGIVIGDGADWGLGDVIGVEGRIMHPDVNAAEGEGASGRMDTDKTDGEEEMGVTHEVGAWGPDEHVRIALAARRVGGVRHRRRRWRGTVLVMLLSRRRPGDRWVGESAALGYGCCGNIDGDILDVDGCRDCNAYWGLIAHSARRAPGLGGRSCHLREIPAAPLASASGAL